MRGFYFVRIIYFKKIIFLIFIAAMVFVPTRENDGDSYLANGGEKRNWKTIIKCYTIFAKEKLLQAALPPNRECTFAKAWA